MRIGASTSLWLHSLLLCLPAVAMCALGWRMLAVEVPRAEVVERSRVGREYRRVAEGLLLTGEGDKCERGKGWRRSGKIDGIAWGHFADGDDEFVWVGDDEVRSRRVPRETAIWKWVRWGIVGGMFTAALLTGFCLRYFVRYARERDEFLAAALHDLRTPLAGLQLTVGRNVEEAKLVVEIMRRRIENLREFMRLGGKRPAPKLETVDLAAVFRSAYVVFREDFRELFDGEDLPLATVERPLVVADLSLITQLVWNLLSNSLKYAAPYGRVAASIRRQGGKVALVLSDLGPGLSAADRRRVFKRYFRAASAVASSKGGFGIGLTIARDFARQMHGDLTIEPNRPHGCIFTLTLPATGEIES